MKVAYQNFWKYYREIKGRTGRREFWLTQLVHLIVLAVLGSIGLAFLIVDRFSVLPGLLTVLSMTFFLVALSYLLISLLPNISLILRRLNSVGLPKLLALLLLAPAFGQIALIIFMCLPEKLPSEERDLSPVVEEKGKVDLKMAFQDFFKGYFDFSGRTTRAGFWWMELMLTALAMIFAGFYGTAYFYAFLIHSPSLGLSSLLALLSFVGLFLILPVLSMQVRRLRDAGLANKWIILIYALITLSVILRRSLAYVAVISYGRHSYPAMDQILALLVVVLAVTIFIISLTPTDGLHEEDQAEEV